MAIPQWKLTQTESRRPKAVNRATASRNGIPIAEAPILQQAPYLLPEHRPWLQTIPDEFTSEIYRVYGWTRTTNNRGPRYAGKLIRQLIYERLPKPVLPALDEMNPTNTKYQRKHRHHQFLTDKQGLDHFRSLVITTMTLLRISKGKGEFKRHLEAYFGSQLELDFDGEH